MNHRKQDKSKAPELEIGNPKQSAMRMHTEVSLAASGRNNHARRLFAGIARSYDRPADAFSLFQYRHWHRFLVSRLAADHDALVLDVATGPGGVAIEIAQEGVRGVVGLDLSEDMLRQAQDNIRDTGLESSIHLVNARAEDLPFPDRTFDAVVFTFLLRYVDDPEATVRELGRVLKPGGQLASLEFYVPHGPILHPLWLLHTRVAMPVGTRFLGPGWREVGAFLGPNISNFFKRYTLDDLSRIWTKAGMEDVHTRTLSQGGAVVMWGRKAGGNAH